MVLRLPQDVPRAHNDLPGARIARWNQGRTNAVLGVRHRHARARSMKATTVRGHQDGHSGWPSLGSFWWPPTGSNESQPAAYRAGR